MPQFGASSDRGDKIAGTLTTLSRAYLAAQMRSSLRIKCARKVHQSNLGLIGEVRAIATRAVVRRRVLRIFSMFLQLDQRQYSLTVLRISLRRRFLMRNP